MPVLLRLWEIEMLSKHVTDELSTYCNGELTTAESQQVAEHLIGCIQCRAEFEETRLGVKFAERIPQFAAPASLWRDIEAQIEAQPLQNKTALSSQSRSSFRLWQPRYAAIAAGIILAIGIGAFWIYRRESRPFWDVARLDGSPTRLVANECEGSASDWRMAGD